ncbi:nucleoside phosphorylase [Myroides guanonis]|uniref:Uridine phosphorylase n=1 Tax=Myroides guanonis TaxID=1150112 RepID=A0A1I3TJF2_9FLAO|nr:nucleoside phosphorylase [Myroides guanonis]SFJ69746.1 uridine phosphorylase [Myroides guanonis]
MEIKSSELILNPDGSVYHLNIKPEDLAENIIFVGDQDRVERISKHFDSITFQTQKREFKSQTGYYKGKRFTVISTGIGPDNIDIVMNEIDALANIDFNTRHIKKEISTLNIVRIGTSGSLHKDIPVNSFLLSEYGIGMDNMLHSYLSEAVCDKILEEAFMEHTQWNPIMGRPYAVSCSKNLAAKLKSNNIFEGITATAGGFYGAQGRILRLPIQNHSLNTQLESFNFNNKRITNLEMETAAIYGMSKLLGHNAVSMNAIIANRANGTFSEDPYAAIDKLILYTLEKLSK